MKLSLFLGIQWNLYNLVTNGPVLLGCNKEVAALKITSIKRSHLFLFKMATIKRYNDEHVAT